MRSKCVTVDCSTCGLMTVNEIKQMTCTWGAGKPKLLKPQKGKKPLECNLTKEKK